jgi:hypothetical protein
MAAEFMWFFDSTIEAEKAGGWSRSEAWLVATRARRADREGMNRLHKVPDLSRLEIGIDFVFLRLCEFLIAVSRLGVSLVPMVTGLNEV